MTDPELCSEQADLYRVIRSHGRDLSKLDAEAIAAAQYVLTGDCERKELLAEDQDCLLEWQTSVLELIGRLRTAPRPIP